jgi:hypothetical protein
MAPSCRLPQGSCAAGESAETLVDADIEDAFSGWAPWGAPRGHPITGSHDEK